MKKFIIAAMCCALLGCNSSGAVAEQSDADVEGGPEAGMVDSGDANPSMDASWDGGTGGFDLGQIESDPMIYQGGPVMTAPLNVYTIWYGSWANVPDRVSILQNFISHLDGSNWFNINTGYYQQSGVIPTPIGGQTQQYNRRVFKTKNPRITLSEAGMPEAGVVDASGDDASEAGIESDGGLGPRIYVNGSVSLAKSVNVGYTHGTSITDQDIGTIVNETITSGQLPLDANGAYIVFTSADVSEGGIYGNFCFDFCGWHNDELVSNTDVKYVFVGDVASCLNSCSLQSEYQQFGFSQSPNGDWSADGMVSIIGHELSELVTDPEVNTGTSLAWTDDLGEETGDKCAWTFGQPYRTSNSVANVRLGSNDYMIQQLWVLDNDGGRCDLHQ